MKFVADESIDQRIVIALRQDGHDVLAIAETSPSRSDEMVLQEANSRGAILLTADKDFGELIFRQRRVHSGVILLRLAGLSPQAKVMWTREAIKQHGSKLAQAFSVIGAGAVRIRRSS